MRNKKHINLSKALFVVFFFAYVLLPVYGQFNTNRILSIGRNALYFEDYVLSIQYFNQVIRIKPYLIEPYYYRAIAKIQLEDFSGAEQDLNEVIKLNPFRSGAYYARGFARIHQQQTDSAANDFLRAVALNSDNLIARLHLIEIYEQKEMPEKALEMIDYLLKRTEQWPLLNAERGHILLQQGDTAGALKACEHMITIDSFADEGWAARALIRLRIDDSSGALSDYNKAIERNALNPNYFINRGILNYRNKNYNGALNDYDRAIELDAKNKLSRFNRALLREEVGDLDTAIDDLSLALKIDPDYSEARYKRALIYMQINKWSAAENDFTALIDKHPYFLPAYYGRAEARKKSGKQKSAYADIVKAEELNAQKGKIKQQKINTQNQYAEDEKVKDRIKIFDSTGNDNLQKSKYDNLLRGDIQNNFVEVVNERNFNITYYAPSGSSDIKKTAQRYFDFIAKINNDGLLPAPLKITNKDIALSSELIEKHNKSINTFSEKIQQHVDDPYLFFGRGLDFALICDFGSSIEDFSHVIALEKDFTLAYFCRANVRYKLLERTIHDRQNETDLGDTQKISGNTLSFEKKQAYDFELIMRDYDRVITLSPDFEYAWFNKANLIVLQKDFDTAIKYYTKAIELNDEFAEAYFNRALTFIYIGKTKEGLSDLSKAGELGIYQAYNLLKRLK